MRYKEVVYGGTYTYFVLYTLGVAPYSATKMKEKLINSLVEFAVKSLIFVTFTRSR